MKWSARLGRFAGIDVYVHVTFLLLLAWIAYSAWTQTHRLAAVASGLVLILLLFFCVLLHEFGHALAARRYGIATRHITLLPIGGVASLESMPRDPRHEIVVALAGPAVNVAIAALLFLLLVIAGRPGSLLAFGIGGSTLLPTLLAANVMLAVFNLLPAFPMDGGRVLRALLALRLGRARATMIAARVGRAFAVALGLYGLWSGNVILVLIAAFVWIGSGAEAGAVAAAGRGSQPAGSAMRTSFEVLAPADPLTRAVDLSRAGPQKDFPVLAGDRIAGVLTESAIRRGLHDLGPDARVAQLMTGAATADVATPLAALLEHMRATGTPLVLVTRDDRLAGIVDLDSASASLRRPRRR